MTILDLFENIAEEVMIEEAVQSRVKSGKGFEEAFSETYVVQDMGKGDKRMHMDIKALAESSKSDPQFFEINDMFSASLQEIDIPLNKLTLFKGDFQNKSKNLEYKNKEKERTINGGSEGNYFELKKGEYKLKSSLLYSELKKFANRSEFIKLFANENEQKRYENEKDRSRKSRMFTQISNRIIKDKNSSFHQSIKKFNHNINRLNGVINTILSKDLARDKIKNNLKEKLSNKDWFFVTGTGVNDDFVFHKIDVNKFVDNVFTKIRKWKLIGRISFNIKIGDTASTVIEEEKAPDIESEKINIPPSSSDSSKGFDVRMSFQGTFESTFNLGLEDMNKITSKTKTNEEVELYNFLKEVECL